VRGAVALLAFAGAVAAGGLSDAEARRWLRFVQPAPDELKLRAIPWRATLWDAVVDAHREKKPILLWAMNGHPLACT